jgi:hypothetical protein
MLPRMASVGRASYLGGTDSALPAAAPLPFPPPPHVMQRRLALNLAPIELASTAELRVGLQPYDDDRLDQLRDEGRGTYFYKRYREQDAIACVALDDAYAPQGTKVVTLRCADVPWLVSSLVLEALLAFFHENGRPVLGYKPLRIVTRQKSDELLRRRPIEGVDLPEWLERRISYVFDTRTIYPDRRTPRVALACDVRVANIIAAPASELLALGVPLAGRYVQVRQQGPDARLRAKLRLAGRVVSIRGAGPRAILVLDDHDEGMETVPAAAAYLEPRQEHVALCLQRLVPQHAAALMAATEATTTALRNGREQVKRTETLFDALRGQPLELAPGVPFRLGPLLRQASAPWFPVAEDLPKPVFVLDPSGSRAGTWHQGELDKSGPYDRRGFTPKTPKILVVCQAGAQGQVEQWLARFLDGMPDAKIGGVGRERAPYAQGFVRRFHLQDTKVLTVTTPTPDATGYAAACRKALQYATGKGFKWDLAFVQIDTAFRQLDGEDNPYLVTKALLLKLGVPVQAITLDTMRQHITQLPYTMNNISLASYAKLGGVPWLLKSQPTVARELVLGLGSHEVQGSRFGANERLVGITTVFSADGSYLLDNKTMVVPYAEYAAALLETVREAVRTVGREQNWKPSDTVRLIFHAVKPFRDEQVDTITRVVAELGHEHAEFAFLQFSEDHPYRLFDEAQEGAPAKGGAKKGVYAPPRGLALELTNSEALVAFVGPNDVKKPSDGTPQPALLRLHRSSTFTDMTYLTRQAFNFSGHSWRSFFPARLPITIIYSELIASLMRCLEPVKGWDADAMQLGQISRTRWFL